MPIWEFTGFALINNVSGTELEVQHNGEGDRVHFVGKDKVLNSLCDKDLGIRIGNHLNFDTLRKEKIKTATRMVRAIRRAFRYLN